MSGTHVPDSSTHDLVVVAGCPAGSTTAERSLMYQGVLLRIFASHPVVLQGRLLVPARRLSYTESLRWFLIRIPDCMLAT